MGDDDDGRFLRAVMMGELYFGILGSETGKLIKSTWEVFPGRPVNFPV